MKKRPRRTLELSVKYAPRINGRYFRMLDRICERNHMPQRDVLRYGFEAALLSTNAKALIAEIKGKKPPDWGSLNAMITVRTTRWIGEKVEALWRGNPDVIRVDVLRALLERILPIARDKGMAYVMKIREENL